MIEASVKTEIAEQLDSLPYDLQRRVLDFARVLALSQPKGVPGKQLLDFAGAIKRDDLEAMTQAIEEGCERINPDEW